MHSIRYTRWTCNLIYYTKILEATWCLAVGRGRPWEKVICFVLCSILSSWDNTWYLVGLNTYIFVEWREASSMRCSSLLRRMLEMCVPRGRCPLYCGKVNTGDMFVKLCKGWDYFCQGKWTYLWSFPGGAVGIHLPMQEIQESGFDPRVRKIPWSRKWQPT